MNFPRTLTAITGIALLAGCMGCGWSTPGSKKNTMTGVSSSGYPGGKSADPESPALGSMKKTEKAEKPEKPLAH